MDECILGALEGALITLITIGTTMLLNMWRGRRRG